MNKETAKPPCYVYFILNYDSQAIKIGIAKNVKRRLASLQTSSSSKLELLSTIKTNDVNKARKLEQSLHQQFGELCVRGEWFKAQAKLLRYIDKLGEQ